MAILNGIFTVLLVITALILIVTVLLQPLSLSLSRSSQR